MPCNGSGPVTRPPSACSTSATSPAPAASPGRWCRRRPTPTTSSPRCSRRRSPPSAGAAGRRRTSSRTSCARSVGSASARGAGRVRRARRRWTRPATTCRRSTDDDYARTDEAAGAPRRVRRPAGADARRALAGGGRGAVARRDRPPHPLDPAGRRPARRPGTSGAGRALPARPPRRRPATALPADVRQDPGGAGRVRARHDVADAAPRRRRAPRDVRRRVATPATTCSWSTSACAACSALTLATTALAPRPWVVGLVVRATSWVLGPAVPLTVATSLAVVGVVAPPAVFEPDPPAAVAAAPHRCRTRRRAGRRRPTPPGRGCGGSGSPRGRHRAHRSDAGHGRRPSPTSPMRCAGARRWRMPSPVARRVPTVPTAPDAAATAVTVPASAGDAGR